MYILDTYLLFVLGDKLSYTGYMLLLILDYQAEMPTSRQLQVSQIPYNKLFYFLMNFQNSFCMMSRIYLSLNKCIDLG